MNQARDALVALLEAAGAAHGVYETSELHGVYDLQWAQWYAAYLVAHGIGDLLPTSVSVERLRELLTHYDLEYRSHTQSQPWPDYYAARLLGNDSVL